MSSQEEQRQIIGQLQVTYTKGTDLQVGLILAGKPEQAAEARTKNRELEDEIDPLIARLLEQWNVDAQSLIADGKRRNRQLQAAIRDIQRAVDIANKAIKAIGHIDDAVSIAKGILAPF